MAQAWLTVTGRSMMLWLLIVLGNVTFYLWMWICGYILFPISVVRFVGSMSWYFSLPVQHFQSRFGFFQLCLQFLSAGQCMCPFFIAIVMIHYRLGDKRQTSQDLEKTLKNSVSRSWRFCLWNFQTSYRAASVCQWAFPVAAPAAITAPGTPAKG